MSSSLPQRLMNPLRHFFADLSNFLGRLETGRLILLCILLLIAANMVDGWFPEPKRPKRVVEHIELPAPPPAPPAADGTAPANPPPTPSTGTPPDAKKDIEIKIGSSGIVISGSKDLERVGRKIEQQVARELEHQRELESERKKRWLPRVSLPELALLLCVLMFIIRLIARSKVKADERVRSAESAAGHAELERQLAEARMQAMQAQVEPHFLFNTLAAVEHLIETDPPRAAAMQRNLIAYLRSVLPNLRRADSTLGREFEISRNYLEILKVRMEDRLEFAIAAPSGLESATMPPLMLQSLVENAIEHGLEPKTAGGRIDVGAAIRDGLLVVTVSDTGVGFTPGAETTAPTARAERGLGLSSIRERLKALYGERGRLIIEPVPGGGTRAVLEFPYAYQSNESESARADR